MKIFRLSLFVLFIISLLSFLGLTVRYASLDEITSKSDLIVHGKVTSINSVWESQNIYTYSKIELYDVIKGSKKNSSITIKQLGGKVGEITQEISGTPKLFQDSEVFLFLVDWKQAYWIHSIVLGYYEVVEMNGNKYAVNNFNDVELIDAKTGKNIDNKSHIKATYELSSLKSQIKNIMSEEEK